jgi:hypothetical protein
MKYGIVFSRFQTKTQRKQQKQQMVLRTTATIATTTTVPFQKQIHP